MSAARDGQVDLATGFARYRCWPPSARPSGGAVMLLAGLGVCARDTALFAPLVQALTAAGHQAVAVDWDGQASERSLASEVEAVLAVVDALVAESAIDAARVVIFGHSLGALVAALAASALMPAGVVVYGAAARRFADALEAGALRQLPLRGFAPAAAIGESRAAGELYRAVLREGRPRSVLAEEEPRLLACVAAADLSEDTLFGGPLAYLRTVDAIEPAAAWRRVSCPVHVIQGSFDWVVGEGDAQQIADWAPAGSALLVPSADHYFGDHADLTSSMRNRGAGAPSAGVVRAVVANCDVLLDSSVPEED